MTVTGGKGSTRRRNEFSPALCSIPSTEDGLEQDFNSLHAQREAYRGAYVRSQAGEGWKLLPDLYDDGGFSGTMDRQALPPAGGYRGRRSTPSSSKGRPPDPLTGGLLAHRRCAGCA